MPNITGVDTSSAVFYAMDPEALEKYAAFKDKISAESVKLSSEEIKRIKMEIQSARAEDRPLFTVSESGVADISVAGPLEPKADPCAIMFGVEMTTYEDIIKGTRAANEDPRINTLRYHFSTPGGNVVGLFAAADAIRNSEKPTEGIVYSTCASAGYALASQCWKIDAENISAEIGSIGVVTEIVDRSAASGQKRYILTSQNAENKRPDVTTDSGRAKILSRINELESVFIEYVALGRNTTTDNVIENFGKGGMLIARKARAVGMIDSILSEINAPGPANTTGEGNQIQGAKTMADITMSEEQLNALVTGAAEKAAANVKTEMSAEMDRREAARKAESERMEGFGKLKAKYPEMSGMIDEEMKKEGSLADLDFAMKVADADKSRLAAAGEQKSNASDPAITGKVDGNQGETDNSGNLLCQALGLKLEGGK